MASKLRAKILDAKDIKTELVVVPEWDVTVEVRCLTGAQQLAISKAAQVKGKDAEGEETSTTDNDLLLQGLLLAATFDPETGERVFEMTDADGLYAKAGSALNLVSAAVLRVNGMAKKEDAKIEKNSVATDGAAGASV